MSWSREPARPDSSPPTYSLRDGGRIIRPDGYVGDLTASAVLVLPPGRSLLAV